MRNLKRVLSLVLALMMALSLMALTTVASAADSTIPVASDFNDYNDVNDAYKEAADVVVALGIIQGKDTGLDPAGNLTRAEAVIMIERVLLGDAVVESLSGSTSSPFVDIGPSFPYGDLIAYAANTGIVSGDAGSKQFFPSDELNTVSFGKILLGALGYDSDKQGYTGSMWHINVFADMAKAGINLNGVGMFDNLTREQAMQMIFQTLQADMVTYDVNGKLIKQTGSGVGYNNVDDGYVQFCESYCSDLKLVTSGYDAFGRPTSEWQVNNKTVSTQATQEAVVSYTAKSTTVAADLRDYTYATSLKATENGTLGATAADSAAAIQALTGNGKVVEVYATGTVIDKVVVVEYMVGELNVTVSSSGNVTYSVNGTSGIDYANNTADTVSVEGSVAKGDIVTAVRSNGILHIYPTTQITGTMAAYASSAQTITVDGAVYTVGTAVNKDSAGATQVAVSDFTGGLGKEDYSYFVDQYGFVVKCNAPAEVVANDYLYIVQTEGSAPDSATITNPNGADFGLKIRAVLADGTVDVFDVKTTKVTAEDESNSKYGAAVEGDYVVADTIVWDSTAVNAADKDCSSDLEGNVYAYSVNRDGTLTLTAKAAAGAGDMAEGNTYVNALTANYTSGVTLTATKSAVITKNTVFVVISGSNDKTKATVYTGGLTLGATKMLTSADTIVVMDYVDGSTGAASVVFTTADIGTAEAAPAGYAYVDAATETISLNNGKEVTSYEAITAGGEKIYLTKGDVLSVTTGVWQFNEKNELTGSVMSTVEGQIIASGTMIKNGLTWLSLTDETQYIYIDESLSSPEGNTCVVIAGTGDNAGTAEYVFVIAAPVILDPDPIIPGTPTQITGTIAITVDTSNVAPTGSLPTATADNENVNVSIEWSGTPGSNGSLNEGTYTGTISVTAKTGYALAEDVQYKVNSGEAKSTVDTVSVTVTSSTTSITGTIALTVDVSDITTDDSLPTTVTVKDGNGQDLAGVNATIAWKDSSNADPAQSLAKGAYTGTITVTAKSGYALDAGVQYNVNNGGAKSSVDTVTVKVYKEIDTVYVTVTGDVSISAGDSLLTVALDETKSTENAGVDSVSIAWVDSNSDAFDTQNDTTVASETYTGTITATADAANYYKMASTYTVSGTGISNNQIDVTVS